jgi:hypothetical protein
MNTTMTRTIWCVYRAGERLAEFATYQEAESWAWRNARWASIVPIETSI